MLATSNCDLVVEEAIVGDLPLLSGKANLKMIGLEMLFRVRASKKFCARVKRGEVIRPPDVWPPDRELEPNDLLFEPFVEASTKWEKVDRYLSPEEAAKYVDLTVYELFSLYQWVSRIAERLSELYGCIGATLIDGKVEVAKDIQTGEFVIIDGISLDELGVVYNGTEYGKNPLRNWYKENHPEWYQALQQAQKDHPDDPSKWPEYTPLDPEVAFGHVERYKFIASRLENVLSTYHK